MISVILPYWKRPEVTHRSLVLYQKHYEGVLDFEVILVDDGSHDFDASYPWLRIEKLPKKETAKNPCVPINHGVRVSKGNIIVLSNPEILHNSPVLPQMLEELQRMGEMGYVLAACWYELDKKWHCRSDLVADGWHHNIRQPKGSGFHFCGMMYRSLWDKTGGFDEAYRDGWCYDDPDFVNRVAKAGGVFKVRDDLVVEHIREGALANWNLPDNRNIFEAKWPG